MQWDHDRWYVWVPHHHYWKYDSCKHVKDSKTPLELVSNYHQVEDILGKVNDILDDTIETTENIKHTNLNPFLIGLGKLRKS